MSGKRDEKPLSEGAPHQNGSLRMVRCPVDGKEFESRRSNATYCSPACRAQASRERRGVGDRTPSAAPSRATAVDHDGDLLDLASRVTHLEEQLEERDLQVAARVDARVDRFVSGRLHAYPAAEPLHELFHRVEDLERANSLREKDPTDGMRELQRKLAALEERVGAVEDSSSEFEKLGVGLVDMVSGFTR